MACFRYIFVNTCIKVITGMMMMIIIIIIIIIIMLILRRNVKPCTIHFDCFYYHNLTESLFHDIFFVDI